MVHSLRNERKKHTNRATSMRQAAKSRPKRRDGSNSAKDITSEKKHYDQTSGAKPMQQHQLADNCTRRASSA